MNDDTASPRSATAPWEYDGEARKELQALLAELEARLEEKEADWRRAGLIPVRRDPDSLVSNRPSR